MEQTAAQEPITITVKPDARKHTFAEIGDALGQQCAYLLMDLVTLTRTTGSTTLGRLDEHTETSFNKLVSGLEQLSKAGLVSIG